MSMVIFHPITINVLDTVALQLMHNEVKAIASQHSSRMRKACLLTASVFVAVTRCQYCWGEISQAPCQVGIQWNLWTYSPPGHSHPLLVTPDGLHWIHTHPLWTDRHLWKHYLPTTSFADGKNLTVTSWQKCLTIQETLCLVCWLE